MKQVRVNDEARCPACLRLINGAGEVNGERVAPRPRDLSVCSYCGNLLVFNTDLTVRSMQRDDFVGLSDQERADLALAVGAVRRANGLE